jgi:hypothetical protein
MYLASEAVRFILKDNKLGLTGDEVKTMKAYKSSVDDATRFIPLWVKVAVAIALGLGAMIGWKRIVVTVGEKIGKQHLTYAQGASAELVAMSTIFAADNFGLPVSTTHVLSSGVAGTMAANSSGLQFATVRNLLMAWVLTLPTAMLISGSLYSRTSSKFSLRGGPEHDRRVDPPAHTAFFGYTDSVQAIGDAEAFCALPFFRNEMNSWPRALLLTNVAISPVKIGSMAIPLPACCGGVV